MKKLNWWQRLQCKVFCPNFEQNNPLNELLDIVTAQRDKALRTLASADREIERLNLMVQMMDESTEVAELKKERDMYKNIIEQLGNMAPLAQG